MDGEAKPKYAGPLRSIDMHTLRSLHKRNIFVRMPSLVVESWRSLHRHWLTEDTSGSKEKETLKADDRQKETTLEVKDHEVSTSSSKVLSSTVNSHQVMTRMMTKLKFSAARI